MSRVSSTAPAVPLTLGAEDAVVPATVPAVRSTRLASIDVVHTVSPPRHYFACRLQHLATLPALGPRAASYEADRARREIELVSALIRGGEGRVTYDLRLLAGSGPPGRRELAVVLLGRVDGMARDDAARHPRDVLHLLEALFDECGFGLLAADDVPRLLAPFPVRHLVAVARRVSLRQLDTAPPAPGPIAPGFLRAEPASVGSRVPADAIFAIHPFAAGSGSFATLCRLLLRGPSPVAISVRLRPAALTDSERTVLQEQLACAERYAQVALESVRRDLSTLRPTLREQAREHERALARMLRGLEDAAALMTVEIASPHPVPRSLADTVGAMLTVSLGGLAGCPDDGGSPVVAGGYHVERLEAPSAVEAFETLDLTVWPDPLAPPGAERLRWLLDAGQARTAFRLPPATLEALPGLPAREWRFLAAPERVAREGSLLGMNRDGGHARTIRLGRDDRRRHVYVVGQTGTGKTTLLKTMILEDLRAGNGLCVVDPHGDLFRELLGRIPEERIQDVILLDPTNAEHPVGLNLLEHDGESQRHFVVQELAGIIGRLMADEFGAQALGTLIGPVFFQHMRMNLLLAMSNPADPGTLLEFHTIYQEPQYWRRWLPLRGRDPLLERWVAHVLPKTDYTRPGSEGGSMGGYVASKFDGFVFDPLLRNIFGQKRSTVDLRAVMDQRKILLVNLAKGELTEVNARFLGMVLLAKLMAAAMGRVTVPARERRDFHLYVDEFQSLATESFVTLLSEARKFGVSLILANQYLSQVRDPRITQAIFGNVGTLVAFRLGQADAEVMERELVPAVTRGDLVNLPNWHAYVRTLVGGQAAGPFTLETVPDRLAGDQGRARQVQAWSRRTWGRPRQEVEAEIARSLAPVDAEEP